MKILDFLPPLLQVSTMQVPMAIVAVDMVPAFMITVFVQRESMGMVAVFATKVPMALLMGLLATMEVAMSL